VRRGGDGWRGGLCNVRGRGLRASSYRRLPTALPSLLASPVSRPLSSPRRSLPPSPRQSITRDASGAVTGLAGRLNLEGDVKKTKLKLTWLAADAPGCELLPLTLVDFDYLIAKKKVRALPH
jgi:hypothetical protein